MEAGSAVGDVAMGAISAHELTKTHLCKTPGCEGDAKAAAGRHCYCPDCQVRRGTASADGRQIPPSPGAGLIRRRRHDAPEAGPYEAKVLQLAVSARELDFALRSYRSAKPRLERAIGDWRSALVMFKEGLAAPAADPSPTESADGSENGFRETMHEIAEAKHAERPDPRLV